MSAALDRIARKLGLGQAGAPVKPAPTRRPAKLSNVTAALANASAKLPPPPTPTPAPARQPSLASVSLQRDSDGRLSGASVATATGSRHDIVISQRDEFGRLAVISIDGRRAFRVERGYYGQAVGLVPIPDTPMEYDK